MRKALIGVGLSTLVVVAAAAAARLDPTAKGLRVVFFSRTSTSIPLQRATGVMPTADGFRKAIGAGMPAAFEATLSGSIVTAREGSYVFSLQSDGKAAVFIDGRPVVALPSTGDPRTATGEVDLTRGLHTVFVQYLHESGEVSLDLKLARGPGTLRPIPEWAVRPPGVRTRQLALGLALTSALVVAEWVWVGALLMLAVTLLWRALRRVVRTLVEERLWPSVRWVLLGSLLLNATAFWWGLPAYWAQDELTPTTVFDALAQHFSHGWFDRYPPFHYYVLTAAMSPVLLLDTLGRIDLYAGIWPLVLILLVRMVSLAAAAGIVTIVAVVGGRVFGPRAGVLAAAIFALAAPFVYYAKTGNLDVPYVFWFAASLLAYLRLFDRGATRDYVLFAAFATLSIATKDQAYGLYVLTPIVIGYHLYRQGSGRGLGWWRWLVDRRLAAAVLTGVVVFSAVHNLAFNSDGFRQHVEFLTGPGSENYRTFPPSAEGRLALLLLSGHLVKITWGWPLTLVTIAGVALAFATRERRWMSLVILTPAVSYYLTFINVILYNYDRFVLPICLVLAVFGGFLLDRVLSTGVTRTWRAALAAAAFGYTILYSATVDALMLGDGRYEAEQWLRDHGAMTEVIGVSGPAELRPRLPGPVADISSVPELESVRPPYYVLSADYARAVLRDSDWGRLIAGLQAQTLGYRLAARCRRSSPWPWLPDAHPDLVGPRPVRNDGKEGSPFQAAEAGVFSILRTVNPTIEIFRRQPAAQQPAARPVALAGC